MERSLETPLALDRHQKLYVALFLSISLASCSQSASNSIASEPQMKETIVAQSKVDLNLYPMTKTVCDPFNQQPVTNYKKGLKANLFYRVQSMPRYYSSKEYIEKTWPSEQNLFFSQMDVPTRLFTAGFRSETGQVLKNDSGQTLIEYFGLKFQSSLVLADNDEEGLYDIALLSDDGSTMSLIERPGVETPLIENDGDHPTRMGCSNKFVRMKKGQKKNFVVTYYQGPRMHIANVMMWRKVDSETAKKDSLCGATGNDLFFDYNNNSAPRSAYNSLLSRGWKVVSPDNFLLEDIRDYNPCVDAPAPVISSFRLNEASIMEAWFSWKTDIPASSQILVTEVGNNNSTILTASDNNLRLVHELHITGLKHETTYKVKAISISQDLGRGESPEITFTTP